MLLPLLLLLLVAAAAVTAAVAAVRVLVKQVPVGVARVHWVLFCCVYLSPKEAASSLKAFQYNPLTNVSFAHLCGPKDDQLKRV